MRSVLFSRNYQHLPITTRLSEQPMWLSTEEMDVSAGSASLVLDGKVPLGTLLFLFEPTAPMKNSCNMADLFALRVRVGGGFLRNPSNLDCLSFSKRINGRL